MTKKKLSIVIIFLFILTGCSTDNNKIGKEISTKTYEYASKQYDNKPIFNKDNSNIEVYDDNDFYYILLTTEQGSKDKDTYLVFNNTYKIHKNDTYNISENDFEILNNKDEVVSKNFMYEEKNIDLNQKTS